LKLAEPALELTQLKGDFRFDSTKGLSGQNITARAFDKPVTAQIFADGSPGNIKTRVNASGQVRELQLRLRIKFRLGEPVYDQFTVVIILNIGNRVVGMVVDRVSDVTTLLPEQIKPAPDMGRSINTEYVIGLGTIDERMLILVDIDQLMSSAEMGLIEKLAA